ncbi:MAG: alanine racemase [Kiritimatiellia bacterium]|jgi:alanine racemase
MEHAESRVVLDIDLDILAENYRKIAASVAPLQTIAVLKADAYGLGMRPIAQTLAKAGAAAIATAELAEALAAVDLGLPVLILGTVLPDELDPALRAGVRVPIAGLDEARAIGKAAERLGVVARGHLALDTGMGRVGIRLKDAADVIPQIAAVPNLVLEGLYSHFPAAYLEHDPGTPRQVEAFLALAARLRAQGIALPWLHIANSDAINNFPETACHAPFTHVRTGINLYGSFDTIGNRRLHLRPVLTMRARLAQVRTLSAGSTIGYGRTFTCPGDMRIGTVAAGYADGLPLALSNRGSLLIRNRACPVVGRISMDYTTVALDQVADAQIGDEVVCVGGEAPGAMSVEAWAMLKGTHPYEVICSFGSRVKRRYISKDGG